MKRGWDLASWLEKLRYIILAFGLSVGCAAGIEIGDRESSSHAETDGVSAISRREQDFCCWWARKVIRWVWISSVEDMVMELM